jgi:hypothetical protein
MYWQRRRHVFQQEEGTMLDSHPWAAGFGLLALTFGGCTTAPPSPLAEDHPASIHAPAASLQPQPTALSAYRDFGTAPATPPAAETPPMDHSMHKRHEHGAPSADQDDAEDEHAHH